ncbi:hypothetical protein AAG906_024444 [Vitis piasezkii]
MGATDRTHVSHPEHPLELKNYKKPYTCDGCKEPGFGSRTACSLETTTHDFFGNAAFKFHLRPPNSKCKEKHCRNHGRTYCDACGKAFRLQDKVSRRCNWCKEGSRVGWAYASSNDDYYFHVGCVPEMMLEAWQNGGGGGSGSDDDDDGKSVAVVSKMKLQLQRNSKGNGGRGSKYWKMLKSILRIVICFFFLQPLGSTSSVTVPHIPTVSHCTNAVSHAFHFFSFPSIGFLLFVSFQLCQTLGLIASRVLPSRCWRAIIHKNGVTSRRDIHRQPSTQTLKLKPAQKPDHCVGCKELEFDLKPCYQSGPKRKEYGLVCDVCGKDVKGWFTMAYHEGNHFIYTHVVPSFHLRERKMELGLSNSRCGKYCYQVSCVKGKVEEGRKRCGDQKQSVGTEAS